MLSIPVVDGGVGVVVVVIVVVASPEKKIMFRSVRGKLFSQRVLTSFSQNTISSIAESESCSCLCHCVSIQPTSHHFTHFFYITDLTHIIFRGIAN